MLRKLFRYDMKYTAKLVLPLMLLTLGTTLMGSIAMRLMSTASDYQNSFAATLLSGVLGLIIFGSILILVAFAVISSIIVFVRYYKHFFSDEGYLTHTLPVKTTTHMFSKTWSTLLWVIITTVAVLFFVFLYVLIGSAPRGALLNTAVFSEIGEFFHYLIPEMTASYWLIALESILGILVSIVFATFMIFTAITIGAVVAKKHKILAAIGFYYLINTAVSIITVLIYMIVFASVGSNAIMAGVIYNQPESLVHFTLIFSTVFYLALSASGFALCNHFLKKKLNLA